MIEQLHRGEMQRGEWWACAEAERPSDDFTAFDLSCPRCRIALGMVTRTWPLFAGVDVRTREDRDGDSVWTVLDLLIVLPPHLLGQGPPPSTT